MQYGRKGGNGHVYDNRGLIQISQYVIEFSPLEIEVCQPLKFMFRI